MRHALVETAWVVDCFAPAHNKVTAALDLLERAAVGELQLHIPMVCLVEARRPLHTNFQPRQAADLVRRFLTWAREHSAITQRDANSARLVLDKLENVARDDLGTLEEQFEKLRRSPGVEIFSLNERMIQRNIDLAFVNLDLRPLDHVVLAAVLVRSEELLTEGHRDIVFCTTDRNLQPWDKSGARKEKLAQLYDASHVWVYGDYLLSKPSPPADWHSTS